MAKKTYTPIEYTDYFKGSDGNYYTQIEGSEKLTKIGKRVVPKEVFCQEHRNNLAATELKECREKIAQGRIPSDPMWTFKIGESVRYGAHTGTKVVEVLDNGLIYKTLIENYRGKELNTVVHYDRYNYHTWVQLRKATSGRSETELRPDRNEELDIRFYNSDIESLISKIYHSGVDFEPEYQRDFVWSKEQKVALIDSIFRNIEIGKFSFIKKDYSNDLFYEILDGKQRLTALREFYENRFTYKDKTFDELGFRDQIWFKNFNISWGETEEPEDRKRIYAYFCKLNTAGQPMDPEHLEKIKKMAE